MIIMEIFSIEIGDFHTNYAPRLSQKGQAIEASAYPTTQTLVNDPKTQTLSVDEFNNMHRNGLGIVLISPEGV